MLYVLVVGSNVGIIRLAVNYSQAHMAAALIVRYCTVFTAQASMLGGLESHNSVCLSVRPSQEWIVTKLNDALQIF